MKPLFLNIFLFASFVCLHGRSVVYNFRIAQITKEHIFETAQKHHTSIGLIFDEISQRNYEDIRSNYFGSLFAFIYKQGSYFIRGDFAVSKINRWSIKGTFSDTQTDDLLITIGKNFSLGKNFSATLSGLFGFPTHPVYILQKPQFGFGQYGLGAQLDSDYQFNKHNSLLIGSRYVYYFPRKAIDELCNKHTYSVGNLFDLLIASKNVWGRQGLEIGYTSRFVFQGKVFPAYDHVLKENNYIRSTWYGVYQYRFAVGKVTNRFLFNIAAGFDHVPKYFGNKYIVFLWGAWDVRF